MARSKPKRRKPHEHSVVETLLISGTVVMFWRGAWGLMDIYLFPKHHSISYGISFTLSVLLFIFVVKKHTKHIL